MQEPDEEQLRRITRLPFLFGILLILAGVVIGQDIKGIQPTTLQATELIDGKAILSVQYEGVADLDKSLSVDKKTAIFNISGGLNLINRTIKNRMDAKTNTLLDCDLLTCDYRISISTAEPMRIDSKDLTGGFQYGEASVEKVFFYDLNNWSEEIPTYSYSQRQTLIENGTTINQTVRTQNGTVIVNHSDVFENEDIGSVIIWPGHPQEFVIRFSKATPQTNVDIYDTFFGIENKEAGWWNNSCGYSQVFYMNSTSINAVNTNITVRIPVNTSNSAMVNQTTGANIAWIDSNGVLLNSTIDSTNSTWLGNSTNNATYLVIATSLNNKTLLTNFTAYYCPLTSNYSNPAAFAGSYYYFMTSSINTPSGSVMPDLVGSYLNTAGVFTNSSSKCKTGSCYIFNGASTHFTNSSVVWTNTSFTVSYWEYEPATMSTPIAVAISDALGTSGMFIGYDSPSQGYIRFYVDSTKSLNPNPTIASSLHHTMGVYNGTIASLYLDGVLVNSTTVGGVPVANHGIDIGSNNGYNSFFNGTLDNVYFMKTAQNADYAQADYGQYLQSVGSILTNASVKVSLVFTSNGSSYIYGPVQANVSANSTGNSTINLSYNWFKNGANQTALAGSQTVANNSITTLDAPPLFTIGDNWSISVWANDGTANSSVVNSTNTTIQNYFSSINITTPASAYSGLPFNSTLNFTLAGAPSASAYFVFNTSNTTGTDSGVHPIWSFNATATAPVVAVPTNFTGTWYYRAVLANGSYYETSNNTTNVTVGVSGFYLCNSTINATSINYIFLDSITHVPVNASLVSAITWSGGVDSLTQANYTTSICINPPSMNVSATISETATATGYFAYYTSRPAANYSNATTNHTIYLINTTFGGYYSFRTINPYNAPISNATVVIASVGNSTVVFNGTTDVTGNVYTPLTQLQIYTVSASADGYNSVSFLFTAGASTATDIPMQANTTPINLTNPNQVLDMVHYNVLPVNHFFTTPTNLTYTVLSVNNSLIWWGMTVTYNGTLVSNQTSFVAAGGNMTYLANQTGVYNVNIWFQQQGFGIFSPTSFTYIYSNNTGLGAIQPILETGNVISGAGYYIVAIICALLAAAFVSQYTLSGASLIGMIVLYGFTLFWPGAPVADLGGAIKITALMMTIFISIVAGAVFYLGRFGA